MASEIIWGVRKNVQNIKLHDGYYVSKPHRHHLLADPPSLKKGVDNTKLTVAKLKLIICMLFMDVRYM